ncbi:MAG: hypothetical protein WDO24_24095 [Pseudomonadota bacterium]
MNSAIGAIAQQLRGQSPFPDGITTLTTNALANSTAVTLPSTLGMFNGDTVKIKLDNGQAFSAKITTILGDTVNLSTRLPSQASAGAFFTNTAQQTRDQSTSGATAASRAITTTLNASSAAGATTVKLALGDRMVTGDAVQIQLLDGSTFNTTIAGITGSTALSTDALANSTAIAVTDPPACITAMPCRSSSMTGRCSTPSSEHRGEHRHDLGPIAEQGPRPAPPSATRPTSPPLSRHRCLSPP